jgi:hypothetical protein
MAAQDKFSLFRTILKTFGLSQEAVDDVVDRIADWLSEKDADKSAAKAEYPYLVRDDFLSPAKRKRWLKYVNCAAHSNAAVQSQNGRLVESVE